MANYVIDVYRTLAQSIQVSADSPEEAILKVDELLESLKWDTERHGTDDVETFVAGEINPRTLEPDYY
jgi:hypothetical protein